MFKKYKEKYIIVKNRWYFILKWVNKWLKDDDRKTFKNDKIIELKNNKLIKKEINNTRS